MLLLFVFLSVLIYFVYKNGYLNSVSIPRTAHKNTMTIDDKYNSKKVAEQKELDKLLEKINKTGFEKLSTEEKNRLNKLSRK